VGVEAIFQTDPNQFRAISLLARRAGGLGRPLRSPRVAPMIPNDRIAVFPILADVVEVKTGSWSTAHWSNDFIRLNGWLRTCFAQLITPLDIDGIGRNWEESNISFLSVSEGRRRRRYCAGNEAAAHAQGIEGLQAI